MSTIKVTNIEHASTANGGIQLDNAGHVTVDGINIPTAGALSSRRININGDMKVSQRATSKTGITGNISAYYTVDRWKIENYNDASANSSVWTMEQSTDAPEGFKYSLKCTATTANSDYGSGASQTNVETRIEAQDVQFLKYGTANAEKLTLSFWVKSSVTGTYLTWFFQEDDTRHCTKTYTVNTANTWEYKTVTINGDTTGVIDNDTGLGLIVRWLLATGTGYQGGTAPDGSWAAYSSGDTYVGHAVNVASTVNNSFLITGVQLEVGEKATPFEYKSFDTELDLCKRYFQTSYGYGVGIGAATYSGASVYRGNTASTTTPYVPFRFMKEMRAIPTVTGYSPGTGAINKCGAGTGAGGADQDWDVGISSQGRQSFMYYNNGVLNAQNVRVYPTTAYFHLYAHYTAEADI